MDERKIIRTEYTAQLAHPAEELAEVIANCRLEALKRIEKGELMTAALYVYSKQLYLYAEWIGEEKTPESFMDPLRKYLSPWPQGNENVRWVKMVPVFWHAVPICADEWRESRPRQRRRGRIALLKENGLTEYVYHHFALTREGVFRGDKYMFISLYGSTLFSYFEEPRSSDNTLKTDTPSEAIKGWMAVDPDSHFIPLPGSNGQNFLLIEALFDVGEDSL